MDKFDVLVIGTGTAGQTAAFELAAEGFQVAIAESSDSPGGVCALRGCQAKKWFYETMETVARSKHLLNNGITSLPQTDWQQILRQKNEFTGKVPESTVKNIRGNGVTLLPGAAIFIDEHTVKIGDKTVQSNYCIIATGARPRTLNVPGAENTITSKDFLELEALPPRIGFIGGGFISFEFAHFAAHLGGKSGHIHILEVNDRVLGPFDAEMVDYLVEASKEEGIGVHTGVELAGIEKTAAGHVIQCESGDTFTVDLVVNAAGRLPNVDTINLASAGVDYTEKGIEVDNAMRTSNDHIFAIGDCAATVMLARVADREAKIAAGAICAAEGREDYDTMDYQAVPAVLFTYPQLGMVGKTEQQLKDENITYWKSQDSKLSWPTYRRTGMKHAAYKILVDRDDLILGAHFLSDNTTGLVNTFKQAMIDKISIKELYRHNVMAPYPSRESDILYMLGDLVE